MRSHYCGDLTAALIDQSVTLCGWIQSRRDHGGVIFIDLRDRSGVAQIVADPDEAQAFAVADATRNEYVLRIAGKVRVRPAGTINPDLPSGEVEVYSHDIEVLNKADALPFQLDEAGVSEAVRLRHRFLDLRKAEMQHNLRLRHRLVAALRGFLEPKDFIEVETPVLTRSTPEGARDYLVPSRTYPGQFFALPQSPQIFKQLLMVSGFERYYQIARCFRDEDLRADRQPEFTQLDIELSFVAEEDVMTMMETMLREVFATVLDTPLPDPFPRLTYHDAVARFGIDRPDLRIPLELTEVTDLMPDVEFKVFSAPAKMTDGRVAALRVPNGASLTRQQIDAYTEFVKLYGAKGLAYIKVNDAAAGRDGLQSPILKFMPDSVIDGIMQRTGALSGDLIFFGADKAKIVNDGLAALRVKLGHDLGLVDDRWRPLWVVDFPLVEYDAEAKRWHAMHHPFTAPKPEHIEKLATAPGEVLSRAYDVVLNGMEIGGGSIRVHQRDVQQKVFAMLGIDDAEASAKFGHLLEGLRYGAPPHGGIAFGIDRIAAMMTGADSIRDVIAFPKTQKASCLLTDAPGDVDEDQLRELGIRLRKARASAS